MFKSKSFPDKRQPGHKKFKLFITINKGVLSAEYINYIINLDW